MKKVFIILLSIVLLFGCIQTSEEPAQQKEQIITKYNIEGPDSEGDIKEISWLDIEPGSVFKSEGLSEDDIDPPSPIMMEKNDLDILNISTVLENTTLTTILKIKGTFQKSSQIEYTIFYDTNNDGNADYELRIPEENLYCQNSKISSPKISGYNTNTLTVSFPTSTLQLNDSLSIRAVSKLSNSYDSAPDFKITEEPAPEGGTYYKRKINWYSSD
ncbi:hypothetical protein JXB01_00070 [Candidatus Micrarchaeota archaeon]|nr:hypothetical protein [Candidatus Micrarchaeota archaeon]